MSIRQGEIYSESGITYPNENAIGTEIQRVTIFLFGEEYEWIADTSSMSALTAGLLLS